MLSEFFRHSNWICQYGHITFLPFYVNMMNWTDYFASITLACLKYIPLYMMYFPFKYFEVIFVKNFYGFYTFINERDWSARSHWCDVLVRFWYQSYTGFFSSNLWKSLYNIGAVISLRFRRIYCWSHWVWGFLKRKNFNKKYNY